MVEVKKCGPSVGGTLTSYGRGINKKSEVFCEQLLNVGPSRWSFREWNRVVFLHQVLFPYQILFGHDNKMNSTQFLREFQHSLSWDHTRHQHLLSETLLQAFYFRLIILNQVIGALILSNVIKIVLRELHSILNRKKLFWHIIFLFLIVWI